MELNNNRELNLFNEKTMQHSNLNELIKITITSIFNYQNLLSDNNKKLLSEQEKNEEKEKEINEKKRKALIELYKKNKYIRILDLNKKPSNEKNSILSYQKPEFEIYIIGELYVDNIKIEPENSTKILFNSKNINYPLNFQYYYKNLTIDSYIILKIYSMEFEEKNELLGEIKLNLFDENGYLLQGRQIYSIDNTLLNTNNENEKEIEKNEEKIFEELSNLINKYYNIGHKGQIITSNYYSFNENQTKVKNNISDMTLIPADIANQILNDENSSIENILNTYIYHKEQNFIEIKDDLKINFEKQLNNKLIQSQNSFIEIDFLSFKDQIIFEENILPSYNEIYKLNDNDWICDSIINKAMNEKILFKEDPIREKISSLFKINNNLIDTQMTPEDENKINQLIKQPDFIQLDSNDLMLFWIYRYKLLEMQKKFAITKILNSVKWGDSKNEKSFIKNILYKWEKIEISDILYMLSRKFCVNQYYKTPFFVNKNSNSLNEIRKFAVGKLKDEKDENIQFILLQLVQALRYENYENSPLKNLLIEKCSQNIKLATSFYWFIECESNDKIEKNEIEKTGLTKEIILNYKNILEEFKEKIKKNITIHETIKSQIELNNLLLDINEEIKDLSTSNLKKEKIKKLLKTKYKDKFKNKTYSLPFNPKIKISNIDIENIKIFSSATQPIKYTFDITQDTQEYNKDKENPSKFELIFKTGDDLRQDQLILQIISYMDALLKQSFQEYGFTTYKVMAMSKDNGIVEFIPKSKTIQDINNLGENPIKTYLEKNNNKTELKKKLENFRLSCVGYCVVTYILGIGDRHLENLMIKEDGKMFHIDFGFILGNDPKTYPPPFKICSQMIQAMGGKDSEKYKEFKKFCINAYWVLRDNARLIVNMFYLMIDSGILQINNEDTLFKLHDKFVPELSKSEAEVSFLGKLDDSVNALFPIIYDKVHSFMQYWRNK